MIKKVECPYCGAVVRIYANDCYDAYHYCNCPECGKAIAVYVLLPQDVYCAEKLNCKNGLAEHKYEDVPISSRGHTIRCCRVCDEVEEGAGE